MCVQHGEQALLWAARAGHINVIRYLKDQRGLSLDTQNKVCYVKYFYEFRTLAVYHV